MATCANNVVIRLAGAYHLLSEIEQDSYWGELQFVVALFIRDQRKLCLLKMMIRTSRMLYFAPACGY